MQGSSAAVAFWFWLSLVLCLFVCCFVCLGVFVVVVAILYSQENKNKFIFEREN